MYTAAKAGKFLKRRKKKKKTSQFVPLPPLISSHIAALRSPSLQLIPHAHHLPRGLVVRGVVIIYAAELAKLDAVDVLHGSRAVELLHPHAHAHIFHLKQLHYMPTFIVNFQLQVIYPTT